MNSLGVFLGPKVIGLVESNGKNILRNVQISRSRLSVAGVDDKVPEDVKLVALLKDELRRNNITANDATLCLSGSDLIVRTFEMPMLSKNEFKSALFFEAKKYIPFKMEDLVSDYQVILDRSIRKNIVLFVAIRKDTLAKYLAILRQLGLKVSNVEYSAFSVLRFAKLLALGNKGVSAVISVDIKEEDEASFVVMENGFPLFSRDITLAVAAEEAGIAPSAAVEPGMLLEKFKTELRVSVDFFHRKFPKKNISKALFVANPEYQHDMEMFMKEISIPMQFIDVDKCFKKPLPFSLSIIKAFGASLFNVIKAEFNLNLLAPKLSAEVSKASFSSRETEDFLADIKLDWRVVVLGLLICAATYGFGIYRIAPVEKALQAVKDLRPQVFSVVADSNIDELENANANYKKKIEVLDKIIRKQLFLTSPLDSIPRIVPEGVWLTSFRFSKIDNKPELVLTGVCYLADSDKEYKMINDFVTNLRQNAELGAIFSEVTIISVEQISYQQGSSATTFTISCKGNSNERE